jgi:histidine triad (HIT) family protein
MPNKPDPVLDALKQASKGLVFTSDTDAPLEAFAWKGGADLTHDRLLELAGADKDTPVEETNLDSFFRAVPSEDRAKFQKLIKTLQEQLSGVEVYKLGDDAEKDVYIVGKTTDGRWAGVKTTVVET